MDENDLNVFFIPYRPGRKPKKNTNTNNNGAPQVSRQKHVAREYHRKAKLKRQSGTACLPASYRQQERTTPPGRLSQNERSDTSSSLSSMPANNQDSDKSINVFDAGVGQLDPFNAVVPVGASSYNLDILDYATSKQWTIFKSSTSHLAESNIKTAVFSGALRIPAAFWTLVFAGATHNAWAVQGANSTSRDKTMRLALKHKAIQEVSREIEHLQGDASDELLLAIITLAAHGSAEMLDPPAKAERSSILSTAQDFEYYGRIKWEFAHLVAIFTLVHQKGGLHNLKIAGLANSIALADIFYAFHQLRRPGFPLLAPTSLVMSTWPDLPQDLPSDLRNLATGFSAFEHQPGFKDLYRSIHYARLITIGYEIYLSKDSSSPTLNRIVWARNYVAHDLLSLHDKLTVEHGADAKETDTSLHAASSDAIFSPTHVLYRLFRWSTIAYFVQVLFPMPREAGVQVRLSKKIMMALDDSVVLDLWGSNSSVMLWSIVLGGIMSDGTSLSSWFTELARQGIAKIPALARLSISEGGTSASWHVVHDICYHFLWSYEPECEGAGKAFWEGVTLR